MKNRSPTPPRARDRSPMRVKNRSPTPPRARDRSPLHVNNPRAHDRRVKNRSPTPPRVQKLIADRLAKTRGSKRARVPKAPDDELMSEGEPAEKLYRTAVRKKKKKKGEDEKTERPPTPPTPARSPTPTPVASPRVRKMIADRLATLRSYKRQRLPKAQEEELMTEGEPAEKLYRTVLRKKKKKKKGEDEKSEENDVLT